MKLTSIIIFFASALFFCPRVSAQVFPGQGPDTEAADSSAAADVIVHRDIFADMPSRSRGDRATVEINQSQELRSRFDEMLIANASKKVSGYRIRIYFSNAQNARDASSAACQTFTENYPGYNAYRSFVMPNFKVTVGDFRTKSEALELLGILKRDFPSAFIVRENINVRY